MALYGLNTLDPKKIAKISKDNEVINAHLERLLFTGFGEIIGYPQLGSRIPEFFWEPMNEETASDILSETQFLIETYEPRINIESLSVTFQQMSPADTGLIIELEYTLVGDDYNQYVAKFVKIRDSL